MHDALGHSIGIQADQKRKIAHQNHRALRDEGREQPLPRLGEAKVGLLKGGGGFEENDNILEASSGCAQLWMKKKLRRMRPSHWPSTSSIRH